VSRPVQLALDFEPRPALEREDFLVTASNADAVAWLDRWPDWPVSALVVYGPPASGKTHLSHVWQAMSGAGRIEAAELGEGAERTLFAQRPALVIESVDRGVDEPALFNLLNIAVELGRHLLLTGEPAPGRWQVCLPDLGSRLNALPAVGLGSPDDALLSALLVKQLADRQLGVTDEVVRYAVSRMERSFEAVRWLAEALDETSLAEKRRITVPLVGRVLEALDVTRS
jgi:chromosomal replication initiation ATPase DnaA